MSTTSPIKHQTIGEPAAAAKKTAGNLCCLIKEAALAAEVRAATRSTAHGAMLDEYFGITSRRPRQSQEEAARCCRTIQLLRDLHTKRWVLADLIAEANCSGADADALRELTYGDRRRHREDC